MPHASRRALAARRSRRAAGAKLAQSVHTPADWIVHAKVVARSWNGLRTRQIAAELRCRPATVRKRLHAFNERGLDGAGLKPSSGRTPRLTAQERSVILALIKLPPPGKPTYDLTGEPEAPDPAGAPEWTLDTLTAAAHARGIEVARSQVRRSFRRTAFTGVSLADAKDSAYAARLATAIATRARGSGAVPPHHPAHCGAALSIAF